MKALLLKIRKILRDRRVRRAFTRIVGGVSALAVFITTYALILPAITMETEAVCGIEAHQHDDSCYSEELICEIPESDGHHHTDECYIVTQELICELQEHVHTQEAGCYDEEGNLICELQAHEHDDACYKEVRTLTCGLEESDGHHHGPECYKKVLACGMEVHTHSEECYKDTSRAVVASTSMTAEPAQTDMVDSNAETEDAGSASDELSEEDFDAPTENAGLSTAEAVETADELLTEETDGDKDDVSDKLTEESTNPSDQADDLLTDILSADETSSNTGSASDELTADDLDTSTETDASPSAETADAAAEATTDVLPEEIQEEDLSDGFIPSLDPLYMEAMLTKETAFYYYHPEDGETVEDSSAINNWKKANEKTELAPTDLVRMYLPYTLPAGSLNQTNQIARYRLPAGIRFTDDQIININQNVNGVAASCLDGDTAEDAIDDDNSYEKYLGAEAVEGKRRPDQELREGETEYVSAVVKVENVFDESTGEYEGQDLIFIFTPYTIEENQNAYDSDGDMTAKGRKVSGWFAVDFNMSQIDWVEDEFDEDLDNTTIGKTASFLFAAKDKDKDVDEIRRDLRLVENTSEENTAEDIFDETVADQSAASETAASAEHASESATEAAVEYASEIASADTTGVAAESAAETATENAAQTETASAAETADAPAADNTAEAAAETNETAEEYTSGTLEATGDGYRITLDYTAEARIPENAALQVREITEASDKEAYEACLEEAKKQVAEDDKSTVDKTASRFFDIEIVADGKKIEPEDHVNVNIQLAEVPSDVTTSTDQAVEPTVLHFAEEGVEQIDSSVSNIDASSAQEDRTDENNGGMTDATEIQFEANSFSVYGVVYTVDFHYSVNGKEYEFSLAGGDTISFSKLVKALHLLDKDNDTTASEEEIIEFINDIDNIQFSDENLIQVAQITEGITAGGLKQKLGITPDYAADLTEAQIAAMDARVYYAPDWVLISLKAFNTAETITVTLKDGEVFTIDVTDAQIKKSYISASGETYDITVTYDNLAGIPDDADLRVSEIEAGSKEYNGYLRDAVNKLAIPGSDVSYARFFDIEIIDQNGEKVEPKTAVQVEIAEKDAMEIGDTDYVQVIHFAEKESGIYPEIISDVKVSEDNSTITYEQSSFSVSGKLITSSQPESGEKKYMMIVPYEGRYYIVNNDASLTEVGYDEATDTVSVIEPMLWTFDNNNNDGDKRHIYFNSTASGFNQNQTASDWFRRYLDPEMNGGTLEETSGTPEAGFIQISTTYDGTWNNPEDENKPVEINHITAANRKPATDATGLSIDSEGRISSGGSYFGITKDDKGLLHLVGYQTLADAVTFKFATAYKVPDGSHLHNAVNHIDISIKGDANITVPLAYGKYYDENKNLLFEITGNTKLSLSKDQVVDEDDLVITTEDMKRATIVARDKNGNEIDDAFYITGFSQNVSTNVSTNQVRIEGSFLVSELRGTQYEVIDGTSYDGNFWSFQWPNQAYVNAVRQARLDNKIDYTVSVVKSVKYKLVNPEHPEQQLYDSDGTPLTVTVDVPFNISFNYWDQKSPDNKRNDGNECPPVQNNPAWVAGDIPNHDLSGMDFKIGGENISNIDSKLPAIEITKMIVDENHNTIKLGEPVTSTFEIWENRDADRNSVKDYKIGDKTTNPSRDDETGIFDGYTMLHTKTLTVGEDGMELVFDHNVSNGMYYIVERSDENSLQETIQDKNGQEYKYVKTYIETEYIRRGEEYYDDRVNYPDPRHVSDDYERGDTYKSSPEVIGDYYSIAGPNTQSEKRYSEFIEYYVYNVYSKGTKLDVEKEWLPEGEGAPEGAEVKAKLYYATRENDTQPWPTEESGYQEVKAGQGDFADYPELVTELTLSESKNWKGMFADLPETITKNSKTYQVKYYAKEEDVTIPGNGDAKISIKNAYNTEIVFDEDGKEIIRNKRDMVSLDAQKEWATDEGTVIPEGAEVTVELRYATRKVKNSDGSPVQDIPAWSDNPKDKESYAPVFDKDSNTYAVPFVNDPQIDQTKLITELTLKIDEADADHSWKDVFTNLPKYLLDTDGSLFEVDYYAMETAITVPDGDGTKDVKDEYMDSTRNGEALTEGSIGTVIINNRHNVTSLDVDKEWAKGTTPPDQAQITVGLYYARRMIRDYKGLIVESPQWVLSEDAQGNNTVKFVPVIKSRTDSAITYNDFIQNSPDFDSSNPGFEAEIILKEDSDHPQNSWNGTFSNLPKYIRDTQGNIWELDYNAVETAVRIPGKNETTVNENAEDITENYTHTEVKTDAEGTEALTSDGTVVITNSESVVIKVKKEWEPETPPAGAEAVVQLKRYKVEGEPPKPTTEATVVKVWDDDNNRDGVRPDSITMQLLANGTAVDGKTVTLPQEGKWSATLTGLDELDNSEPPQPITYSWSEDNRAESAGYSLTSTVTRGKVTTLTNSYTPEQTSRTVNIHWDDAGNQDGKRPDTVTLSLMKNVGVDAATLYKEVTISNNDTNDWTETVTGLPAKEDGKVITYTWTAPVLEDERAYTAPTQETNGTVTTISYSHTPEKTSSTVRIVWDDANDQDGLRPDQVKVTLSNGEQVTLKAEDNWTYTTPVTLDKYENKGQEVAYSWTGEYVGGYSINAQTANNETTLAYSHTPKPPKDYVTVTIHTVLEDPTTGKYIDWDNNGWRVQIDQLMVNGQNIASQIATERGDSNYWTINNSSYAMKAPIYFDVDKNVDIEFEYYAYSTSDSSVRLDYVIKNGEDSNFPMTTSTNGRPMARFNSGTNDIDLYFVVTGQEIDLPDCATVKVAVATYDDPSLHNKNGSDSRVIAYGEYVLNSDVTFNIARNDGGTNLQWNLLYWKNDPYSPHWEAVEGFERSDTAPESDVTFNVGIRGEYIIFIYDSSFGGYNATLSGTSAGGGASNKNLVRPLYSSSFSQGIKSLSYTFESVEKRDLSEYISKDAMGNVVAKKQVTETELISNASAIDAGTTFSLQSLVLAEISPDILRTSPAYAAPPKGSDTKGDNEAAEPESQNGTEDENSTRNRKGSGTTIIKSQEVTLPTLEGDQHYVKDTAFDTPAVTLTLKAEETDSHGNKIYGWEQSFPAQDKYDEYGRPYIYYVVETSFKPEGYVTESITVYPDDSSRIIVKNVQDVPTTGTLSVTKAVTGLDAGTTKTYQIAVKGPSGHYYDETGVDKGTTPYYVEFNQNDTKTWTNLEPGDYTVEEQDASQEGYSWTVSGTGSVHVSAGGTGSTTVTNTYVKNPGDLSLKKIVTGNGADTTKQFAFTIQLTAPNGKILEESYIYTKTGLEGDQTLDLSNARTDNNTKAAITGIQLKAGDTYVIKGLPAGTVYSITEDDYSAEGYASSATTGSMSGTIQGGTVTQETVEVTNTMNVGSLTVDKTVAGNAGTAEAPTKQFSFKVTFSRENLNGNHGTYKTGNADTIETADTSPISFTNGSAEITFQLKGGERAEFNNLPVESTFVVEEISKDADGYETTVTTNGGTYNPEGKKVIGTIAKDTAVTASYTNTKETTAVEASKNWKSGEQTVNWPADIQKVAFTLYKTVDGTKTSVTTEDVPGITNPFEIDSQTEGKKASWSNLPTKYLVNGVWKEAVYSVAETKITYTEASGISPREKTVDIAAVEDATTHQLSVTNELEKVSIQASKQWKDKDGNILTAANIPAGAKVTFTLMADGSPVAVPQTQSSGEPGSGSGSSASVYRTVELDGNVETPTPSTDDYESPAWTAHFTNLPKYKDNGSIIIYTVKETGTWTGYSPEDGVDTVSDQGIITNKENGITLDIYKVERGKNTGLQGAVFTLRKIDGEAATISVITGAGAVSKTATTGENGLTAFEKLTTGYYEITEDTPPTGGYIITGISTFYIEVADDGIHMLNKPADWETNHTKPSTWEKNAVSYGNVKTFEAATSQTNAKATVENDRGNELPSSGGPGTHLYYLLGSALAIFAATLLGIRRTRHGR